MGAIELSKAFLQKVKETFNKLLYEQGERIEIIEEASELPSPLPRLSKNEKFLDELDLLIEKYYPNSLMVGVTDTNSMEPLIDIGHQIVLIPLDDNHKGDVRVGDIIWFFRMADGSPNVLHRVIEKRDDGIVITRGDNTVAFDGFTLPKNIKGFCGMIIY